MILRIDDTDQQRSSDKFLQTILDSMQWLGLDWDEGPRKDGEFGPYFQTQRLPIYQEEVKKLLDSGKAYYCFCTAEELARQKEINAQKGLPPRYSGNCRSLSPQEIEEKKKTCQSFVIRLRVPEEGETIVNDLIRGRVTFENKIFDDFNIVKSDGFPTYNFASAIDDARMKITHVIRANEHLVNTPRQVLIYQALGEEVPQFGHVSVVLDTSGRKMSKRMGDTSVTGYARRGYLPEAVVNFLALLGWSPEGEEEIMDINQLIRAFSLERVSKSPGIFDQQKLDWVNNQYIRAYDLEKLADLALPFLEQAGLAGAVKSRAWLTYVLDVVRDELNCLEQFPQHVQEFVADTVEVDPELLSQLQQDTAGMVLDEFSRRLRELPLAPELPQQQEQVQQLLKQLNKDLKKAEGISGKAVFMPLRVAITGANQGQELYYLIPILGVERVCTRIEASRRQAGI